MTKHVRRHPLRAVFFWLLALCALAALIYLGSTNLQTETHTLAFSHLPAGFDGYRVVHLSDLHSESFGPENADLLQAVEAAKPDLIVITGDLIDRVRGMDPAYVAHLAHALSALAPTYFVTGNHEWATGQCGELEELLREQGVTVLSNAYVTLERNGDTLVLAGIDDPNGRADQKTPEALATELYAGEGDPFWLLLAHRNDRFESQYSLLGADLVLSGHGHGGIIRLPFTDGLLSTDRTFLPSYTAGEYQVNGSTLFVSRGLGNSVPVPRLFNRPEVAVLTLRKG